MVLYGNDPMVERKCQVAGELIDALATIPTAYIQAISTPLVGHRAEPFGTDRLNRILC